MRAERPADYVAPKQSPAAITKLAEAISKMPAHERAEVAELFSELEQNAAAIVEEADDRGLEEVVEHAGIAAFSIGEVSAILESTCTYRSILGSQIREEQKIITEAEWRLERLGAGDDDLVLGQSPEEIECAARAEIDCSRSTVADLTDRDHRYCTTVARLADTGSNEDSARALKIALADHFDLSEVEEMEANMLAGDKASVLQVLHRLHSKEDVQARHEGAHHTFEFGVVEDITRTLRITARTRHVGQRSESDAVRYRTNVNAKAQRQTGARQRDHSGRDSSRTPGSRRVASRSAGGGSSGDDSSESGGSSDPPRRQHPNKGHRFARPHLPIAPEAD